VVDVISVKLGESIAGGFERSGNMIRPKGVMMRRSWMGFRKAPTAAAWGYGLKAVVAMAVIVLAFHSTAGWAAPATLDDALLVGETKVSAENGVLAAMKAAARKAVRLADGYSIRQKRELRDPDTDELLAYILDLDPKGYIVISVDTDITPIIAYSFRNGFVLEDSPRNIPLHMVTWDMQKRLAAIPLFSAEKKQENNARWAQYKAGDAGLMQKLTKSRSWPAKDKAIYGGWLDTQWVQSFPYNMYCPIDPVTVLPCYVGCTATAMAQIVNYWEYPEAVTFTTGMIPIGDDYVTTTRGIFIDSTTASFSGLDYNGNGVHPTNADMGRLSYACGVSVYMDYTSDWSGAWVSDVEPALLDKFGYDSAETVDEWEWDFYDRLEANMKEGRPAELWIVGMGAGLSHAIVCDGYDDIGEYHLNYGWGIMGFGWYSLPDELPYVYSIVLQAVMDIDPGMEGTIIIEASTDKASYAPAESVTLNVTTRHSATSLPMDVDWLEYRVTNGPSASYTSLGGPDPSITVVDTGVFSIALGGYTEPGTHTVTVEATKAKFYSGLAVPRFAVSITVTSPTDGDILEQHAQHNITWTTAPPWSPDVTLSVSTNSGASWSTIATGVTNTGSYLWTVPESVSDKCRIRVMPETVVPAAGMSEGYFSIVSPMDVLKLRIRRMRWSSDGGTVTVQYQANNPVRHYYTRFIPLQGSYQKTTGTSASISGLGDGYYMFVVTAKDPDGNFAAEPCRAWFYNRLRTGLFEVRLVSWSTSGPNLTATVMATEPVKSFYARLYGIQNAYTPSTNTVTYTGLADGICYFVGTGRSALSSQFPPGGPARQYMYVNTWGFANP